MIREFQGGQIEQVPCFFGADTPSVSIKEISGILKCRGLQLPIGSETYVNQPIPALPPL
jgi:hypothetical protein